MSWASREVLPATAVEVGATGAEVESDPDSWGDGQRADQAVTFLDVEYIDHVQIDAYRWGGPSPDGMVCLDTTPVATVTAAGATRIEWPEPPPPWLMTRLVLSRTVGSSPYEAGVRLLQTVRKEDW